MGKATIDEGQAEVTCSLAASEVHPHDLWGNYVHQGYHTECRNGYCVCLADFFFVCFFLVLLDWFLFYICLIVIFCILLVFVMYLFDWVLFYVSLNFSVYLIFIWAIFTLKLSN